jgi:hypothetical protein
MEPNSQDKSPTDASDGASPNGSTHRKLRATLRRVFQEARLDIADQPADEEILLRPALSEVCSHARHAGLRAEQLLILIKEVWSGLPAGFSRVRTLHGDERLNYVISVCVDEYYGSHEASP